MNTPDADTSAASTPAGGAPDQVPDSAGARRLLDQADQAQRSTPSPVPVVLIGYGVLCAAGSFGSLGLHLAEMIPQVPAAKILVMALSMSWVLLAILVLFTGRDRWRRGLARRWIVWMVLWSVLWFVGVVGAGTLFSPVAAFGYLVLAGVALITEIRRGRRAEA